MKSKYLIIIIVLITILFSGCLQNKTEEDVYEIKELYLSDDGGINIFFITNNLPTLNSITMYPFNGFVIYSNETKLIDNNKNIASMYTLYWNGKEIRP